MGIAKILMSLLKRGFNAARRRALRFFGPSRARRLGISHYPPNYIYLNNLSSDSIVVDVGCADDPDYSEHMIGRFRCRCYGVDPTRKHFAALRHAEQKHQGLFQHLPYAVVTKTGTLTFHESETNASGSICNDHHNVKNDKTTSYEVEALSIMDLKAKIGRHINILKLDLEGAEYELLENLNAADVHDIDQLFIEFHHHCIERYSIQDTERLVRRIEQLGFSSFTLDMHNYLFYRPQR